MNIKTVSAKYARKFNLGNYESLELEVAMWADLEVPDENGAGGEDAVIATAELLGLCREEVRGEIMALNANRREHKTAALSAEDVSKAVLQSLENLTIDEIDALQALDPSEARKELAQRISALAERYAQDF